MLTALIAGSLLAQIEQSPRSKSTLPNGVNVYVERLATPGQASVAMAVSLAGLEFKPSEHGWPHLLEHLTARGRNRDLDKRLEMLGMMLIPTTSRDAIVFQITGRPEQMPFAIQCLKELTDPLTVTEEEIQKEIRIMREEYAIRTDADHLTEAAWIHAMGEAGSGPFGTLEAMAAATPAQVAESHRSLFSGGSLGVAAAGDLDPALTLARISDVFGVVPKSTPLAIADREWLEVSGETAKAMAGGAVRGVAIEGIDDPRGAATLMAALVISRELPNAQPIYTPTTRRGLVFVNSWSSTGLDRIDAMSDADLAALYPTAKRTAMNFIDEVRTNPAKLAAMMAVMTRQNFSLNADRLREWFEVVGAEDFLIAAKRFKRESSFVVTGGAR